MLRNSIGTLGGGRLREALAALEDHGVLRRLVTWLAALACGGVMAPAAAHGQEFVNRTVPLHWRTVRTAPGAEVYVSKNFPNGQPDILDDSAWLYYFNGTYKNASSGSVRAGTVGSVGEGAGNLRVLSVFLSDAVASPGQTRTWGLALGSESDTHVPLNLELTFSFVNAAPVASIAPRSEAVLGVGTMVAIDPASPDLTGTPRAYDTDGDPLSYQDFSYSPAGCGSAVWNGTTRRVEFTGLQLGVCTLGYAVSDSVSIAASRPTVSISVTGLAAPGLGTPAAASIINDNTPTVSGTCVSGMTVTVKEGGVVRCSAGCISSAYVCDTAVLADGVHELSLTQGDASSSSVAATVTFRVDTVALAPAIGAPVAGAKLASTTPTLSGTCETGAAVTVLEASATLCTTTCAAGVFRCTPAPLAEGLHVAVARQTDLAGNVSVGSPSVSFGVDTLPPAAPVLQGPGAFVRSATPSITGSCESLAAVTVVKGSSTLCTATCAAGVFSCVASSLSEGTHAVTAFQVDEAGNTSAVSGSWSFTVDSIAPSAPTIVSPVVAALLSVNTPALSGRCESGDTVSVTEGTTALCTATCADSTWSCLSAQLSEGRHTASATQRDAAGNLSTVSAGQDFSVDTLAPAAPVVTAPASASFVATVPPSFVGTCELLAVVWVKEGDTTLCTTTCVAGAFSCAPSGLSEGSHTVAVTQADEAGNTSPATTRQFTVDSSIPAAPGLSQPTANADLNTAQPTISGSCQSGATVSVRNGTTVVCSSSCTASTFSCSPATALVDGAYALTVTQTNQAAMESGAASVAFRIDTMTPGAPAVSVPVVGSLLTDASPTVAGQCEAGASVVVTEGSTTRCSASCATGGTFTCDASALSDGPHVIVATQTDAAGNVSSTSSQVSFTVDTTAPAAPVLTTPMMGGLLNTTTPRFAGTCEAGAVVSLRRETTLLCTATCTSSGSFECTSSAVAEGANAVTASQEDAAGHLSAEASVMFVVDTRAPIAPTVSRPLADARVTTSTPTFSGGCEPDAAVTVREGATSRCATRCLTAGAWSCVSDALTSGAHTVSATQVDGAGNVSPATTLSFSIVAPAGPVITSPADGATLTSGDVLVSGTCTAASVVTVKVDGGALCTSSCAGGGTFSCGASLSGGQHALVAEQVDTSGDVSEPSSTVRVQVLAIVTDQDGDGVADGVDNCVAAANASQADLDGDGIGDACDSDEPGTGCGCGGAPSTTSGAAWIVLGTLVLVRRRRQRA